jgi:hypothetical protein
VSGNCPSACSCLIVRKPLNLSSLWFPPPSFTLSPLLCLCSSNRVFKLNASATEVATMHDDGGPCAPSKLVPPPQPHPLLARRLLASSSSSCSLSTLSLSLSLLPLPRFPCSITHRCALSPLFYTAKLPLACAPPRGVSTGEDGKKNVCRRRGGRAPNKPSKFAFDGMFIIIDNVCVCWARRSFAIIHPDRQKGPR